MKRAIFSLAIAWSLVASAGVAPDTDADGVPDVLDKCLIDSLGGSQPGPSGLACAGQPGCGC
jgi:hypothetical protein